jgi:hypothetical protein
MEFNSTDLFDSTEPPTCGKPVLPDVLHSVFEQYEFKGWLITIENYYGTSDLIGFAAPTKYAHLLDSTNYYNIDEIAEKNGIDMIIDEDGEEYYADLCYIVAEPDDVVVYFLAGIDTTKSYCVLEYMVKEILQYTNEQTEAERYFGVSRFDDTEIVILKQINKKSPSPKTGKRKNGFLNQAWSAMVKERDKKCTDCGSVYDLHAHHVKQYKSHPELRYDINNGITLCGKCHRQWHKKNGR